MGLEKITLLRDHGEDSKKTCNELKNRGIEFREVFCESERKMPCLIISGKVCSLRGYDSIMDYVNNLYPSKQDSQSN